MLRAAGMVALVALTVTTGTTRAAPAEAPAEGGVALSVVGACPDADAVRRALAGILPGEEAGDVPVAIQDQGPRYRIVVRKTATTLDDPGRACAERAREAAVVVAADLRSHPIILGPPVWTIEKGVVFDLAPGTQGPVWAPGAEIRGVLGSGLWSLVGAAGARGPATLSLEGGSKAELLRFPLDIGARMTAYWGRLRPWLVIGGSATPTAILGQDLVQTDRQWRLDLGALAMVGATLRVLGRIGVAAAISARWQPRPYQLQVVPQGTVGETPSWWLGLSLNYTLDGKASSP